MRSLSKEVGQYFGIIYEDGSTDLEIVKCKPTEGVPEEYILRLLIAWITWLYTLTIKGHTFQKLAPGGGIIFKKGKDSLYITLSEGAALKFIVELLGDL
jgi:hypothetical protein